MPFAPGLSVEYRFENGPVFSGSHLYKVASKLSRLGSSQPWLIPGSPFGKSAEVRGGELDLPGLVSEQGMRLRAIAYQKKILVEHTYDHIGRMVRSTYIDGNHLGYSWDDFGRLVELVLPDGRSIHWKYGDDGSLESISYPWGDRFTFEYDPAARLIRKIFPDGTIISFVRDVLGRVNYVRIGSTGIEYDWQEAISPRSWTLKDGHDSYAPHLVRGKISAKWSVLAKGSSEARSISAFGIWSYDNSLPNEMALPDGSLRRFVPGATVATELMDVGHCLFQFNSARTLTTILAPSGTRTAIYPVGDGERIILVSQRAVALLRHQPERCCVTLRQDDGTYAIFERNKAGNISALEHLGEKWTFSGDRDPGITTVRSSSGLRAKLKYGTSGEPREFRLSGLKSMSPMQACIGLSRLLWQLSLWRRTLLAGLEGFAGSA